jgi:hypothetical protein
VCTLTFTATVIILFTEEKQTAHHTDFLREIRRKNRKPFLSSRPELSAVAVLLAKPSVSSNRCIGEMYMKKNLRLNTEKTEFTEDEWMLRHQSLYHRRIITGQIFFTCGIRLLCQWYIYIYIYISCFQAHSINNYTFKYFWNFENNTILAYKLQAVQWRYCSHSLYKSHRAQQCGPSLVSINLTSSPS